MQKLGRYGGTRLQSRLSGSACAHVCACAYAGVCAHAHAHTEMGESWGLLAYQPSKISEFQVQHEILSQKLS